MHLRISPGDELPIYRQIVRQVIHGIAGGHLRPGEQLPSHRDLAETLVIAPLTVKRAYDELEREGYIETARGHGTFVSRRARLLKKAEKLDRVRELARRLMAEAYLVGVGVPDLTRMLDAEDARLRAERERRKT